MHVYVIMKKKFQIQKYMNNKNKKKAPVHTLKSHPPSRAIEVVNTAGMAF